MSVEETIREAVREALRSELPELVRAVREAVGARAAGGEYLTTAEAATVAKVDQDTVGEWIRAGKLPRHRAGRELRVRRDELEAFMAGRLIVAVVSDEDLEERAAAIVARRRSG